MSDGKRSALKERTRLPLDRVSDYRCLIHRVLGHSGEPAICKPTQFAH